MTSPVAVLRAPVRGHLDQVDLFRVLTFAAVVAVHSTAFTNPPVSVSAGAAAQLLHFTREAFFFLTGFVLVYSQGSKPLQTKRFLRRRLWLIGVPYLCWTVLYGLYTQVDLGGPYRDLPADLAFDVVSGRGYFHLYFLLVSMQAYLFFPFLLALLRFFQGRLWWLLGGAAILEILQMLYLHHARPHAAVLTWYIEWAYVLLPTYLLYVVAGAVAARHLEPAQTWLLDHRRLVAAAGVLSAAVALGWFFLSVHWGASPADGALDASTVLQPVMVLWSLGAIALLAVLSCYVSAREKPNGWFSPVLAWCSSASFGVYLVHPLVLDGVLALGLHGPDPRLLPQPAASVLAWVLTIIGSVCVVAVLRCTPLSFPLTGRARPPRRDADPPQRLAEHPALST